MAESETVLIIDDDQDYLFLVERYLASYGVPYRTAVNGAEAIEILKVDNISVVVTDMVMPGMDGMELLKHIRKKHSDIDVMVMTGYSKLYSFVEVIEAGAADFLPKPFLKDEFSAKLDRIFRERALLRELREAKVKAESASKAKTDFLYTIRHELMTPMNGIIGFSNLLKDANLPDEEKGYAKIIAHSADRLMKVINQILDFSAIEAGKNTISPRHFRLQTVLDDLFFNFQREADEKGIVFELQLEEHLKDIQLFDDQRVLGQILNNLMDNAIKFTDAGSIVMSVDTLQNLLHDTIELRFSIKDSGCGIMKEKQECIFEPFTQAEEYMTRKHKGAGLGLATSARLVNLMNGRIWLESQPGKGATFYFTVQLKAA